MEEVELRRSQCSIETLKVKRILAKKLTFRAFQGFLKPFRKVYGETWKTLTKTLLFAILSRCSFQHLRYRSATRDKYLAEL